MLDTHIAVWALLSPDVLSPAERDALTRAEQIVLSAVSVWELRLKWASLHVSGDRKGPVSPDTVLTLAVALGWSLLPMTAAHAVAALVIPIGHRDPFDELLMVQAQMEGLRLLTRDGKLSRHPLAVRSSG